MDRGALLDAGLSLAEVVEQHHHHHQPHHQQLPILQLEPSLGRLLNAHRTVLVVGETSSGKSTQLPQMLRRLRWTDNGFHIAVVQPRKLAAMELANRVEHEMNYGRVGLCVWEEPEQGAGAGNIVFFDQRSFLVNGLAADPKLSKFSVVIMDEAHERTTSMDLTLGLLKRLMERSRPDLRLILASATMDTRTLKGFFPDSAFIACAGGRLDPVAIAYLQAPCADFLEQTMQVVRHVHASEERGDVLVFVPRREECERLVSALQEVLGPNAVCIALHATSSVKEQRAAVSNTSSSLNLRKIVVSADVVAETAITIPGVRFVVDTLLAHEHVFDALSGLDTLSVRPISKSRADQRAGRAGRTSAGKCFRLCTERAFRELLTRHDTPELVRSDLVDVVLMLKGFGVHDVVDFPLPSVPSAESFVRAFDVLYSLEVLGENGELTREGAMLAALPVPVRLGKMLVRTQRTSKAVRDAVVDLVAILASGCAPHILAHAAMSTLMAHGAREGDHLTALNLFRACDRENKRVIKYAFLESVRSTRRMIENAMSAVLQVDREREETKDKDDPPTAIMKCLVAGFFSHAASLTPKGYYRTAREERDIRIHESSVLSRFGKPPPWIVFHESVLMSSTHHSLVALSTHADLAVVRVASAIDPRWLLDVAPKFWSMA